MKLKNILNEVLTEIGETTETYPIKGVKNMEYEAWDGKHHLWKYMFDTPDGDKYEVFFDGGFIENEETGEDEYMDTLDVGFESEDSGVVSKGAKLSNQTFKVLSTVIKVVNMFMKENEWAHHLRFSTTDKSTEQALKKFKLYKAFMDKQLDPSLGFMDSGDGLGSGVIYRK